ncbi:MAG: hypothetical protein AB7P04_02585 [Bacteriovoracia bacterium]
MKKFHILLIAIVTLCAQASFAQGPNPILVAAARAKEEPKEKEKVSSGTRGTIGRVGELPPEPAVPSGIGMVCRTGKGKVLNWFAFEGKNQEFDACMEEQLEKMKKEAAELLREQPYGPVAIVAYESSSAITRTYRALADLAKELGWQPPVANEEVCGPTPPELDPGAAPSSPADK